MSIWGAYIEGDGPEHAETRGLDLSGCVLTTGLSLLFCQFPDKLIAQNATVASLNLIGSCLSEGFSAENIFSHGNVILREVEIFGIVRINLARIEGGLDFDGSTIRAKRSIVAIQGEGIEIRGSIFIRNTCVYGQIRLGGAKIGGQVGCIGSKFVADTGDDAVSGVAFNGESMDVGGFISFDNAEVFGIVSLIGVRAKNYIDFDNCNINLNQIELFENQYALRADQIVIGSHFRLCNAKICGRVSLFDMHLGGNFICENSEFFGAVEIAHSEVANLVCADATFSAGENREDNGSSFHADGIVILGSAFLRRVRSNGEFRLLSSRISGNLDCSGGVFSVGKNCVGRPEYALSMDFMRIDGNLELRDTWFTGEVTLHSARVSGYINCQNARFSSVDGETGLSGRALTLTGLSVAGSLSLWTPHPIMGVLDATDAQIGVLADEPSSWPVKGALVLNNCRYGALGPPHIDVKSRLDWLDLQYASSDSTVPFLPQPYEQLAHVLRNMGHDEDAKVVLIAKERASRAAALKRAPVWRKPLVWLWTRLLGFVGFGYRPELALIPALVVVVVGWGVVWYANANGAMLSTRPTEPSVANVRLIAPVYSFEAFVPIVDLGQVEAFRPDMSSRIGRGTTYYLWFHSLAGWLIGGIAVAGVLRLFRRE